MTKEELIEAISQVTSSKKEAADALTATLDAITSALAKGEKVVLTGFGVFSVAKRAARSAINPRTGAAIKISARTVPKFKAGKGLKEAVK